MKNNGDLKIQKINNKFVCLIEEYLCVGTKYLIRNVSNQGNVLLL